MWDDIHAISTQFRSGPHGLSLAPLLIEVAESERGCPVFKPDESRLDYQKGSLEPGAEFSPELDEQGEHTPRGEGCRPWLLDGVMA